MCARLGSGDFCGSGKGGHNVIRDFGRIPTVGEYVATESEVAWYKVQLVVHTPSCDDYDADVYAVAVDDVDAMKKAMPDFPWS